MIKGKFNDEQMGIFQALEAKKAPIQAKMDELKAVIQADDSTNKMVRDARAEIFEVQQGLVPFAELQAGLASATSREKYFPDLSKNAFLEHVKTQIGA